MSHVGAPTPPAAYSIRHRPWPAAERVVIPEASDPASGLVVTNRSLLRDGRRWFPISGEIHFSRLNRERWRSALELLRAGGVNLVSTYVFWNHHQPLPDQDPDFTGNRDLGAFVRLCAGQGFPVVVRIGPWCHGEVRHGGHPDWLVAKHEATRTDSAGYLSDVERYFGRLGRELGPLCAPAGPVIAVQIENELYDDPQHIRTLKAMARAAGINPPLWTATGWGNAQLPVPEVFPVYSGYSEGFWVDAHEEWDDSFRSHFFFSDQWDDPGVGKDLAGDNWTDVAGQKHPDLPPATCELGGGMAVAYHRRPVPAALDIAAVAHVKLGSGSVWQGYYMYVGGTNPDTADGLQESHDTGYPNDVPRFNYDFHAPIGRDLRVRESFHRLALQHSFLEAFGPRLAGMATTFPEDAANPARPGDRSLRWCLRSDGVEGFVFVNNHQAVEPLYLVPDVQFTIRLDDGAPVVFPPEPVDVPPGALWCFPVGLSVGASRIRWATANVVTELTADDGAPILVMHAHPGLPAQVCVASDDEQLVMTVEPGGPAVTYTAPTGERFHVVVLDPDQALRAWTPTLFGRRRLVLSDAEIVVRDGALLALAEMSGAVEVFDTGTRTWRRHNICAERPASPVAVALVRGASGRRPVPRSFNGRASAPTREEIDEHGARYRLTIRSIPDDAERAVLRVTLVGDVAQIRRPDGEPFDDLFWSGEPWAIDLAEFRGSDDVALDLDIMPVGHDPAVRLTPKAYRQIRQGGSVAEIQAAELLLTTTVDITPFLGTA
ncbi:beta-galactosidase [Allorhizocola rhizosphaerae]|uniref:beta-galactosidase n=1 Tax=Allorhizocola rhizosphaerae TaxID=1872709 RepID=UPI000E3E8D7C|nr:beta-galactosidase [Allorhizocola rhizosphaerae]